MPFSPQKSLLAINSLSLYSTADQNSRTLLLRHGRVCGRKMRLKSEKESRPSNSIWAHRRTNLCSPSPSLAACNKLYIHLPKYQIHSATVPLPRNRPISRRHARHRHTVVPLRTSGPAPAVPVPRRPRSRRDFEPWPPPKVKPSVVKPPSHVPKPPSHTPKPPPKVKSPIIKPPSHTPKPPPKVKPPVVNPPPHLPKPPPYTPAPPIVHPPVIPKPPTYPPIIPKPPVTPEPPTNQPVVPKPPAYPPVVPNPPVTPNPPPLTPPPVDPKPPPESPPPPPEETPCPPPPPKAHETCDTLKLGACVDVLGGLIHIGIGSSAKDTCCPVLGGLLDLDAALCLCTTIRAKLLNINIIIPIALQVLIDCGKTPPSDFQCPAS